jgi:hypothetical protein
MIMHARTDWSVPCDKARLAGGQVAGTFPVHEQRTSGEIIAVRLGESSSNLFGH